MNAPTNITNMHLESVVDAAINVLGARQDRTLTVEEWVDLARAVAICRGIKTADLLTERDLADIAEMMSIEWDEGTDGPAGDRD